MWWLPSASAQILRIVMLTILALLASACVRQEVNSQPLCVYADQVAGIMAELNYQQELTPITEYSSPKEVADYGQQGELIMRHARDGWRDLQPPPEAKLWHDSVEEWLGAFQGGFMILGAAGDRPQSEVSSLVTHSLDTMQGLLYEGNQLELQSKRLFASCQ